jgi:hypothetical protein
MHSCRAGFRASPCSVGAGRQVWVLRPWVALEVAPHLESLAAAAQPTIAFHVRSGDKLQEDQSSRVPPRHTLCSCQSCDPPRPDKGGWLGRCALRKSACVAHCCMFRWRGREARPVT